MNKQNKILLGILAFVVACTIGYALFSESITINGTATASGDFELTTTCETGLTSGLTLPSDYSSTEAGYKNDTCTVSGNTVTMDVTLDYPTATRIFTVKVTNTGTIPAKIDTDNIDDDLTCFENDSVTSNCTSAFDTIFDMFVFKNNVFIEDPTTDDITLQPGESHYYVYLVNWPEYNTRKNFQVKDTKTFPYKQITNE